MIYILYGDPIPLQRPRLGKHCVYNPQAMLKDNMAIMLQAQHKSKKILTTPVHLDVTFYMPIPTSYSKKTQEALLGKYHNIKPDISNLIKFVEDVATGILYKDDKQIVAITARKLYDTVGRTEFTVTEISNGRQENE